MARVKISADKPPASMACGLAIVEAIKDEMLSMSGTCIILLNTLDAGFISDRMSDRVLA